MDLRDIEKHYERISDDEIIRIATTDACGLRPEVFEIIENEIKKRNLDPSILNGVLAQNKDHSFEEIEMYSKLLRDLPCPICGRINRKLNGTILHTVKSFIFVTEYEEKLIIACPDCLDKKNDEAILSTALLGWWGIPAGFFKTPVYIYRNLKSKKENRLEKANSTLLLFTLGNIGEIEAYKNNKEELGRIISTKK